MIPRRQFLVAGAAALALPRVAMAATGRLSFSAAQEEGALVVGHAGPGARVTVDGHAVRVSPDGTFAFGFAYNRKKPARVVARFRDGHREVCEVAPKPRTYHVQRINGLPKKEVSPPPAILKRIIHENAMIHRVRTRNTAHDWFADGLDWPAAGIVSSVYGSQRILDGVPRAPHLGVDIAAPTGTPIHAPADAIVSLVAPDFYLDGGFTVLDHGQGISSCYVHQSKLLVKHGERVKRGQVIGLIGQTGRATGPNLHWGLNWFQVKLDPSLSTPTPEPPRS